MFIIVVGNLKKRATTLLLFIFIWLSIFMSSNFIVFNTPISSITVNSVFTFSYPLLITADRVYINRYYEDSITVSSDISNPEFDKFSTYISLKGKFLFEYPSIFVLTEEDFPKGDILVHIDFKGNENIIHGFVQAWDMPYSLKEFLDNSKNNSTLKFKDFIFKELDIGENKGYLWDYQVFSDNDNKYYKGMEFFFKKGHRMYRISYFVPTDIWNKYNERLFLSIVKSFKVF